jgi:hypothetical protein
MSLQTLIEELRVLTETKLELDAGKKDEKATASMRNMKLAAKNQGDLQSAMLSAGFYAKKHKKTFYVYQSNSYMHLVWRIGYQETDYLNPINNTGTKILAVTPDLEVTVYNVLRSQEG